MTPAARHGCGSWPISEDLSLRLLDRDDTVELQALIDTDREDLSRWLSWAADQTLADSEAFIARSRAQLEAGEGLQAAIVRGGRIAGMVGFPHLDWQRRSAAIGYWLARKERGRGLATAAVRHLVGHAFEVWELDRVEIRVAAENRSSRAVPERLCFREAEHLPEAESVGGRRLDVVLYVLTAAEWRAGSPGSAAGAQRRRR